MKTRSTFACRLKLSSLALAIAVSAIAAEDKDLLPAMSN